MLEGMYAAAAGMAAQQTKLDAVSNDLANASTTGYKHVRVAYRDLAYTEGAAGGTNALRLGAGAAAMTIGRNYAQGSLVQTGNPLDIALEGPGYFQVKDEGKTYLTRDGHLQIDPQGRLSTADGALVDPGITLPKGTTPEQIGIGPDGTVNVNGRKVGQLRIVNVPNPAGLDGGSDNRFQVTDASGAAGAAPRATRVHTSVLEGSNVDMGAAMADMIDAQRSFELASKAIQVADQALEVANGIKR